MIELVRPDLGPRSALRVVPGLRVFPVRHHSPISARLLAQSIRTDPPRVILIEGPADADPFLDFLTDQASAPPLALLAYVVGRAGAAALAPFAEFSPEYQAMCLGRSLGIPTQFCDVPLTLDRELSGPAPGSLVSANHPGEERLLTGGQQTDLWEVEFEPRPLTLPEYLESCRVLSHELRQANRWTLTREAYMMARASCWVAQGVAAGDILLVCGSDHAEMLATGNVDLDALDDLPAPTRMIAFVVPYSYRRLSMASGYGAGLPTPGFSQAIWDAEGQVGQAVGDVLTRVAESLNREGFRSSLADSIDAHVLATNLAALRGRSAPGVAELVQAVESCLTRGRYARASEAVHQCLVGDRVGRVVASAGRSPLAMEFDAFLTHPRHSPPLVLSDRPVVCILDLHSEAHGEISSFLHRLQLVEIPYGSLTGHPGGWKESWRTCWTPALELRLAVASEEGLSIEDVAMGRAKTAMAQSLSAAQAASLFVNIAAARLDTIIDEARRVVDEACLNSTGVPDLCVATAHLYGLVRFEGLPQTVGGLVKELFTIVAGRSLLMLSQVGPCPDDEAAQVATGMSALVDMRAGLDSPQQTLLQLGLERLVHDRTPHPLISGAAAGLALLCQSMTIEAVVQEVAQRLIGVGTEDQAAWFLEGLFRNQRDELVGTRGLVASLGAFVERLTEDEFIGLLPSLRRTFGRLKPGERTRLLNHLVKLHAATPARPKKQEPRQEWATDRVMAHALGRVRRRVAGRMPR